MPSPDHTPFTPGARVITLSAIPSDAHCPIDAPSDALIEVVQVSGPTRLGDDTVVHVLFIYETESTVDHHHALVPLDWYQLQFPLRILSLIPETVEGIDSTTPLFEGPVDDLNADGG